MQVSEKQTRSLEYQCWTEYIWVDEYRCYNTEWGMEMGEEENCEWVGGHAEEDRTVLQCQRGLRHPQPDGVHPV